MKVRSRGGGKGFWLTDVDVEISQLAPRWPPVLPKGTFASPTCEVRIVDGGSVSFVTDRLLKVRSVQRACGGHG
jgi:hypothetical protein